ncbi:MAG TPA: NAD(P)-dependent alcohol dehydrogenase [Saprospiraceae bacterium]|nr:NAD(P)-dependent alcohol dehydrogenase [Saprospiraceae bacterium]
MQDTRMKAIIATGYGGPEVLQLSEQPLPIPKANELLIEVHAASATRAEGMMRTGTPYIGRLFTGLRKPKDPIPGTGFAGVVKAVGDQVSRFKLGDRVFGETTLGFSTNAEYVTVPEEGVILSMPEGMPYTEAVTFSDGHLTSMNFLKNIAQIKSGQSVLINGASGSLGTAAVQLAHYFGAEVTGVSSGRNAGLVESLGAHHFVDYTQQDFIQGKKKYDVIFDTVGKQTYQAAKRVLKPEGLYMSPVLSFSLLMQMMWTARFSKQKAKFAATGLVKEAALRKLLSELLSIYQEGKLKTIIDRQYPLERTADAHAYIAKGHKKGNVVIAVRA